MKSVIVKKNANLFIAVHEGMAYSCVSRGKHKASGIFVGDIVEISKDHEDYVIDKLYERKNTLVRPPVANIDQMLIVISSVPKPDFMLVDKLILLCLFRNIEPVLCLNKTDIATPDFLLDVKTQYGDSLKIVMISAKTNVNMEQLKQISYGKISALAGQSAVGKSMITNTLLGEKKTQIGELSKKINRGKNTTRHTEIFEWANNSYLVDTAGFSFLDEELILTDPADLWRYYPEFVKLSHKCKYPNCSHTKEGNNICAVSSAAEEGKISLQRLERYRDLFETMKIKWRNRHD